MTDHMGTTKMGASAAGSINRQDLGVNYHQMLDNGILGVGDTSISSSMSS